MKQFKNLDEAIHYRPTCPLCGTETKATYAKLLVLEQKTIITFQLGEASIDVDYYGDDITWHSERSNIRNPVKEIFKVTVTCDGDWCSGYGFVLQVHVNPTENKMTGIYLNSESISIERGDELFEIKNIYATNKTEYDRFTKVDVDDGTIKMSGWQGRRNGTIILPLVPMDLSNPEKTLDRIKGLVVFS